MPVKTGLDVMKEVEKAGLAPITVILSGYDAFAYAQQAVTIAPITPACLQVGTASFGGGLWNAHL